MKTLRILTTILFMAVGPMSLAHAQQASKLGDNAALRYYQAFTQLKDAAISEEQAKKLNGILDGPVPFIDTEYRDLIEKNRPAIESMTRGTAIANCDWGLDYQLGEKMPADYIQQAMALGRLNVLYAFHLQHPGRDNDGSVRTLIAGLRFSHDVANGGSLFATLASSDLIVTHLRAIAFSLHLAGLNPAQKSLLRKAVIQLGPTGIDWQAGGRRYFNSERVRFANDPQALAALGRLQPAYQAAVSDPAKADGFMKLADGVPSQLTVSAGFLKASLAEKLNLTEKLAQTRASLR